MIESKRVIAVNETNKSRTTVAPSEKLTLKYGNRWRELHPLHINLGLFFGKFQKKNEKEWWRKIICAKTISAKKYKLFLYGGRYGIGSALRSNITNSNMYADCDYSIILFKKSKGIALIGFSLLEETEPNTIVIGQIQGIRQIRRDAVFRYLRWEQMLVEILFAFAREYWFTKAYMIPAQSNQWYTNTNDTERQKRLFVRYDVTARRLKFKLTTKNVWEKEF